MQVMCKQCLAVANLPDGQDPHAVSWCRCCDADHHHGEAAQACGDSQHPGELCWNPPGQPVKPENCGVCRPVHHMPTVGNALLVMPAGMGGIGQ